MSLTSFVKPEAFPSISIDPTFSSPLVPYTTTCSLLWCNLLHLPAEEDGVTWALGLSRIMAQRSKLSVVGKTASLVRQNDIIVISRDTEVFRINLKNRFVGSLSWGLDELSDYFPYTPALL